MPTPVATARQCLTREAELALDEAVAVARRRGHAQTTSLHLVSSLLSLPSSSILREACSRTRNNAYSTRIQFKALDLCLGVSLDRLPSSNSRVDDPPVSNSLMAAIKRSQANQRRQPENLHFYHHQQQYQQNQQNQMVLNASPSSSSSSSISVVKVELQNLILSILDDPVVSRVFGESGFRSCEIKLAILRPVHQLFRYSSRYKGPPVFLCNLSGGDNIINDPRPRGFSFSYTGFSGVLDGEENYRRIGEIMARKDGKRNPLLVGVSGYETLMSFLDMVQRRRGRTILPLEVSGLGVVSVEHEVLKFISGNYEEESLKLRFEEIEKMVENCIGPGVVVNVGDIKSISGYDDEASSSVDALRFVVGELTKLLEIHAGKVWLIGAAARYETYLKFLNTFPSVEKDMDLQLLPITTAMRFSVGESYPRSSPPEPKSSFMTGFDQSVCQLCTDQKCEEVDVQANGGIMANDRHQSSWLNSSPLTAYNSLDIMKAQDDSAFSCTKVAGCRHFPWSQTSPKDAESSQLGSQITSVVGFQVPEAGKSNPKNDSMSPGSTSSTPNDSRETNSSMSRDSQQFSAPKVSSPTSLLSKRSNVDLCENSPKVSRDQSHRSPISLTKSRVRDGFASPASADSQTFDLNLGINGPSASRQHFKPSTSDGCLRLVQKFSSCLYSDPDDISRNISVNPSKSSTYSHNIKGQVDVQDFKSLYKALVERVGRQEEAVEVISQTITHCRMTNERRHGVNRGDIWFNFIGPDRLAKKEIALALAEFHGSRGNLIHLDLASQIPSNSDDVQGSRNSHHSVYRGKSHVDYIAEKLCKRPFSVLLLENVDRADCLVQSSLSKAVKTGRFSDSHGREFGIGNAIFLTTSGLKSGEAIMPVGAEDYSEEDVSSVKGSPIQMMIGFDLGDYTAESGLSTLCSSKRIFVNKRKLIGKTETSDQCDSLEMVNRAHKASNTSLDLNFPAKEGEVCDAVSWECSTSWWEDFLGEVDATVTFKRCDFDAISRQILEDISECFQRVVASDCSLEIDSRVMIQLVAAAFLKDKKAVQKWVQCVLSKGFEIAQEKYSLNGRSTVKLSVREEMILVEEEQLPSELLPSAIILH
ncbi:OLC1v1026821C1 [Oldenlandia corymbosa var. corymbosa]|uniref:OLC1v1026821C1 n=1 Tax=Oldenlandia corymbosa var. corymbosa TaxID=529605 RepID=A0AAV1C7Y2_OLDCO|nr:OLC1v1026821C1 [Oldenlandia corymbosa var. corymbosa]